MEQAVKNQIILEVIKECSREGSEAFNTKKLETMRNHQYESEIRGKISLVIELCNRFNKDIRE